MNQNDAITALNKFLLDHAQCMDFKTAPKFDAVELTLILKSMGLRLESFDFCQKQSNNLGGTSKPAPTEGTRIKIECHQSGIKSILSYKPLQCTCPNEAAAMNNSFWEVQGTGKNKPNGEDIIDSSSNLLPDLSSDGIKFTQIMMRILLRMLNIDGNLNYNLKDALNNLDISQSEQPADTSDNIGTNNSLCSTPTDATSRPPASLDISISNIEVNEDYETLFKACLDSTDSKELMERFKSISVADRDKIAEKLRITQEKITERFTLLGLSKKPVATKSNRLSFGHRLVPPTNSVGRKSLPAIGAGITSARLALPSKVPTLKPARSADALIPTSLQSKSSTPKETNINRILLLAKPRNPVVKKNAIESIGKAGLSGAGSKKPLSKNVLPEITPAARIAAARKAASKPIQLRAPSATVTSASTRRKSTSSIPALQNPQPNRVHVPQPTGGSVESVADSSNGSSNSVSAEAINKIKETPKENNVIDI